MQASMKPAADRQKKVYKKCGKEDKQGRTKNIKLRKAVCR